MENLIELKKRVVTDFESIDESDFEKGVNLKIYSNTYDLNVYYHNKEEMDGTIFSLWLECGNKKEKTIMVDVPIDELELFANSVLKNINIIRKNYNTQIKYQTENGILL